MRYVAFGDWQVSAVGLGTWPLGGGYDWGAVEPGAAVGVIEQALAAGINLFDTAPLYGDGASEQWLGRVLTGHKRLSAFLASKCGLVKNGSWTDHDLRPKSIRGQLENSLRRLKTDYLDLYFIHYPDPNVPLAEAVGTLARLQTEGKIRAIGLCNVSADQIKQACQEAPVACVQNEYSLLHPAGGTSVFSVCKQLNISFMGYGTLGGGFLSGKYQKAPNFRRADARNYFYKTARGPAFEHVQKIAGQLQKLAQKKEVSPAALAGAWALAQADFILCGAKTALQVQQNARAADLILSSQEILHLEQACEY